MGQVTIRLSQHARDRCKEMGVSTKEVKRALRDPDRLDYPAPGTAIRMCVFGRLAIPYDSYTGEVLTVLWNGKDSR